MKLATRTTQIVLTTCLGLGIGACADVSDGDTEDPADDAFLADGKADAFGVENWSPDGAAVLRLVSTRSQADLDDVVGLSPRVAKNIIAARTTRGAAFTDLAQLDAVPYVGKTVFEKLRAYADATAMFRTAFRVPTLLGYDEDKVSITTWNEKAAQAGVAGFARYTYVNSSTDYTAKVEAYQARLDAIAGKLGEEAPEVFSYGYALDDYAIVAPICYIGRSGEVTALAQSAADNLVGDMYSVWASRVDDEIWTYDSDFDQAWIDEMKEESLDEGEVMLMFTNDDDGSDPSAEYVKRCR